MAAPEPLRSLSFRVMTQEDALEISGWHYPSPYDFYDATADAGDLAELLDPELRAGNYLAAVGESGVITGFAQLVADGSTVDVGLGLRPDLTGHGLGAAFLQAVLAGRAAAIPPSASHCRWRRSTSAPSSSTSEPGSLRSRAASTPRTAVCTSS
jgi:GNAT superfamily N-acetyltransferase